MGAVTGKGLADLIREEFGLRAAFQPEGRDTASPGAGALGSIILSYGRPALDAGARRRLKHSMVPARRAGHCKPGAEARGSMILLYVRPALDAGERRLKHSMVPARRAGHCKPGAGAPGKEPQEESPL
jgi:hypothetical protein